MARIRRHRAKWQVLYRDPATGMERSAGVFRRKGDADTVRLEVEHRVAMGRWIEPIEGQDAVFLRDWIAKVEPTWRRRADSTRRRDDSCFQNLILPYLGDRTIRSITNEDVERWIGTLVDAEYSPATVSKAAQLLDRALQEAVDRSVLVRNPCAGISDQIPKVRNHEPRIINADDVARLADAAGDQWRAFVYFGFYAGTRWGETAAIRRIRLNNRQGTVLIDANLTRDLTLSAPKTERRCSASWPDS